MVVAHVDRLVRAGLHDHGVSVWVDRTDRPLLESDPRLCDELGQRTLRKALAADQLVIADAFVEGVCRIDQRDRDVPRICLLCQPHCRLQSGLAGPAASREVPIPSANVLAVAIENAEWTAPTIAGANGSTTPRTSAGNDAMNAAPEAPTPVSACTPPTPASTPPTCGGTPADANAAGSSRVIDVAKTVPVIAI